MIQTGTPYPTINPFSDHGRLTVAGDTGTIPTASQLLALTGISAADNPLNYPTAVHWKSDLSALWLRGVFQWSRLLSDSSQAPWLPPPVRRLCNQSGQLLDRSLLEPVRRHMRQAARSGTQPDLFRQQNDQIEAAYAASLSRLCRRFMTDGHFDPERTATAFSDPASQLSIFTQLLQLAVLEQSYNSWGLTRLTALKELLKTILMAATGTPLPGQHPYRRYDDNGEPQNSFSDYLAQIRQRLCYLLEADAFDLVEFSEQPAGRIGCSRWQTIGSNDSSFNCHGVRLRYYPVPDGTNRRDAVLYLSSPLINRPEIFDLAPGKSVIEGLLRAGYPVYLVDYSNSDPDSPAPGLDFFGKRIHDHFVDLIQQRHPDQPLHLMGYCMGGTLILPWLARRAEEKRLRGEAMDIHKVILMATPIRFDDQTSGHRPMRELIRNWYDREMMSDLLADEKVPPQLIEAGMNQIQPGVRYTVTRGFFERATSPEAIRDTAPFLNWLHHGTGFPGRAHREWISRIFIGNEIWRGQYSLPSSETSLNNRPVDMAVLKHSGVKIMDYRGERDPISPTGSCVSSETWGCNGERRATTTGLNRTIEKNIGHIFVVSRKHLSDYLERACEFYG